MVFVCESDGVRNAYGHDDSGDADRDSDRSSPNCCCLDAIDGRTGPELHIAASSC